MPQMDTNQKLFSEQLPLLFVNSYENDVIDIAAAACKLWEFRCVCAVARIENLRQSVSGVTRAGVQWALDLIIIGCIE